MLRWCRRNWRFASRTVVLCAMPLAALQTRAGAQQVSSGAVRPVPMARVVGTVIDSTRNTPLGEAIVQLVSAADPLKSRSVVSASDGSFSFDSVRVDTYLLGFLHPRQVALGVAPMLYRVDIQNDAPVSASLFIPSVSQIIADRCAAEARDSSMGMFSGTVRSALDGEPLPRAMVRAQWSDVIVNGPSLEMRKPLVRRAVNENGAFAICGLPPRGSVSVRAWSGDDTSGVVDVELSADRLVTRDLFVGPAGGRMSATAADSSGVAGRGAMTRKGTGSARGFVRRANGTPVRGAKVSVVGTDVEAVTSTTGEYVLRSLPLGTYMLEARSIGLIPARVAADILADAPPDADFALESAGQFLDTVKVRSQISINADRSGFERRRASGFGYYVDAKALERRQPIFVTDVLRTMPGLRIRLGRSGAVVTGTTSNGTCTPAFFVDGVRFPVDGSIDNVLSANDIKGVEVYTRAASTPTEFMQGSGAGSPCAVIVLWTGRR